MIRLTILAALLCGCAPKPFKPTTGPQPVCMMPILDANGNRGYEVKKGFRYVMVMLSEAEYEEFSARFRGDSVGQGFKADRTGKVTEAVFEEKGKLQ